MRSVTFTSGEHVLSPSINSKLRSLILADQAMGLTMAPKFSPRDGEASSSPASSSVSMPAENFTPAHVTPSFTSLAQERVNAENVHSDISDVHTTGAKASVANAIPSGANASAVQWGLTRALPETVQDRTAALNEIRTRHDATCPLCCAASHYTNTVLGEGSANAELVFIGEAPGDKEDAVGKPFQGDSGAKLDEMIKAMGLSREQVFITNVLKTRPQQNQTPTQDQVDQCAAFLTEQLLVIRPKVIVPMGGPAAKQLLRQDEGISLLRGKWGVWVPPRGCKVAPIPVMPTFHPAYLLRNYTLETRALMWSDMKLAMTKLTAQ
jgi:uracil-DNA glycosylase family 4